MGTRLEELAATARALAPGKTVTSYRRARHLPGIVQVTDYELRDFSAETTETIVRRIAAALLAERKRGSEGHWSYSLTRHIALQQAYAAEYDTLAGG